MHTFFCSRSNSYEAEASELSIPARRCQVLSEPKQRLTMTEGRASSRDGGEGEQQSECARSPLGSPAGAEVGEGMIGDLNVSGFKFALYLPPRFSSNSADAPGRRSVTPSPAGRWEEGAGGRVGHRVRGERDQGGTGDTICT